MTDYEAIAHAYRESKRLPIKQYSEEFTLFQVLGSLHGLEVLDAACGDGFYTRAMKRQGAAHVMGVDRSPTMITFAQRDEVAHPLGIAYVIGEAEAMDRLGAFDRHDQQCSPMRRWIGRGASTIRAISLILPTGDGRQDRPCPAGYWTAYLRIHSESGVPRLPAMRVRGQSAHCSKSPSRFSSKTASGS